jgi:fructose-1,6-bisphosphatase I
MQGNMELFSTNLQKAITKFKSNTPSPYSIRYTGSMIADFHRTLLYGGIYLYPSDNSLKQGKLRLLYECAPLAFIMEEAGGEAVTGEFNKKVSRILDIVPSNIHCRSPLIAGCTRDMNIVRSCFPRSIVTVVARFGMQRSSESGASSDSISRHI